MSRATLPQEQFEQLRQKGHREAAEGRLDLAQETFSAAQRLALELGQADLADQALCNRCAISISQGGSERALRELQQVLMRSSEIRNRHLAAYNIALFYDFRRDYSRSLRYARLALGHASEINDQDLIARSHNLVANELLVESYFEEASEHYLLSLSVPIQANAEWAAMMANLGYCQHVIGDHRSGFECLFKAIRTLRRLVSAGHLACNSMLARAHLGLSYGYLEIDRLVPARKHGNAALASAEQAGDPEVRKKSLYLVGEIAKAAGDSFTAYDFFSRLQREFHTDNPALADLLMATDTRQLINLMA